MSDYITNDDIGKKFEGSIVCESSSRPSLDSVTTEVSINAQTRTGTGRVNFELGSTETAQCYSVITVDTDERSNVSVLLDLTGQTDFIIDEYKQCILPLNGQNGGILRADFEVLGVTGSGKSKTVQLSISVRECER